MCMCVVLLVDWDRQWFKLNINILADEMLCDVVFCYYVIQGDEIFYVFNVLEDDRFCDNLLVIGELYICGYVGVLICEFGGYKIGILCVIYDELIDFLVNDFECLMVLVCFVEECIVECVWI